MAILGFDFGSTNTCITYFNNERKEPVVIPDSDGNELIASCIFFSKTTDEIIVGNTARKMLSSNFLDQGVVIQYFKSLIGQSYSEVNNSIKTKFLNLGIELVGCKSTDTILFKIPYNNQTKILSVVEVITLYITTLRNHCCEYLSFDVNDVVITTPVNFNANQRNILKNCFEMAGFVNVIKILSEPTSAALSYIFSRSSSIENTSDINSMITSISSISDEYVIVYDIGGYTTDISLVSIDLENEVYQVKCVHGNNDLGGEMITIEMINYVLQHIEKKHKTSHKLIMNNTLIYQKCYKRLYKECEKTKKVLSKSTSYTMCLDNFISETQLDLVINWTIPILKECSMRFLLKQKHIFEKFLTQCIESNSINSITQISSTVLVGLTSSLSLIENQILDIFLNHSHNNISIYNKHLEKTVSFGACIQGCLINNVDSNKSFDGILLDVLPLSLGIEVHNGIMSPIISRNTLMPIKKSQVFTNSESHIDKIIISIYQGERRFVKDNIKLGNLTLSNLDSSRVKGTMKINVTFDIDDQGILTVSAYDIGTKTIVSSKFEKDLVFTIDKRLVENIIELSEKTKMSDYKLSQLLIIKEEIEDHLNTKLKKLKSIQINTDIRYLSLNHICIELLTLVQTYQTFNPKTLIELKNELENDWFNVFLYNQPLNKTLHTKNIFDLIETNKTSFLF